MVSIAEMEYLSNICQVPICTGTVNRGSDVIGSGVVANDWTAFCGTETTSSEINIIDAIFKLTDAGQSRYDAERNSLIDYLE